MNRSMSLGWVTLLASAMVLVLLPGPAMATFPGSDGEIFLDTDDGLVAVAADGAVRTIDTVSVRDFDVSPDGQELLILDTFNAVLRQSTAGGPVVSVLDGGSDFGGGVIRWSPDGTRFYVSRPVGFLDVAIYDVDGSNRQPIELDDSTNPDGEWASDGMLYFPPDGTGLPMTVLDPATGQMTKVESNGFEISSFGRQMAVSGDASQFLFTCNVGASGGFCVADRSLNLIRQLADDGSTRYEFGTFSPSGSRIAFNGFINGEGPQLLIVDAAGGPVTVTGVQGQLAIPRWSPAPASAPQPFPEPPPPATEAPLPIGGFDGDLTTTERADFNDPTAYAVAVSRARFDGGSADHVVLSRDDAFPDSLAGAALTGDGPLLYTTATVLPGITSEEILRVVGEGGRVYLLGGTSAISAEIEADLTQRFDVVRLAGPSRVETSVAVAKEVLALGNGVVTVAVARASGPADNPTAGWADSVSVGAWTAPNLVATVVTPTESVHPAVAQFVNEVNPDRIVLLGGTAALSQAVQDALPGSERIAGESRAGTAAAIATDLVGLDPEFARHLVVINGSRPDGWLFGLPAAGLAAGRLGAIALVADVVPPETARLACNPDQVEALLAGGFGIITQEVADAFDQAPAC